MQLLYSFFFTLAFIALLPYFAYQALVNRKYLSNLRERLGWLPDELQAETRPTIWLHAVSVGETLAARPLITALRQRFPQHRLIVSTTTATGQAVAHAQIAEADGVCYFPFDWQFAVRRALDVLKPQVVILMESELWLNFLLECEVRKIPVLVANGRISDRSFARARKLGFFTRRLYAPLTRLLMQSQADVERAVVLGAPPERVRVSGNLKYDLGADEAPQLIATADELEATLALRAAPLIIAGSTSEGEEEIILEAFAQLRQVAGLAHTRLLIAPRHPERFDAVARALAAAQWNFVRRSEARKHDDTARTAAVILLDSVGELAALYNFAAVVFIGGSLIPKGGHNILEAARYGKPIIVGPHTENFRAITQEFLRRAALLQLRSTNARDLVNELRIAWQGLVEDAPRAQTLGANARQAIADNRGATARTVAAIAELIA